MLLVNRKSNYALNSLTCHELRQHVDQVAAHFKAVHITHLQQKLSLRRHFNFYLIVRNSA